MGNIVDERPADATATASIDESILRTGVESILAINKLWMQHHVALLAFGLQVGQPLPLLQVLRAGNTGGGGGGTQVAWL